MPASAAALVLIAGALGSACSSALGPQEDALAAARARWARMAPDAYRFEFQRFCFCGGDFVRAVRIEVRDGQVVSAVFVDTGLPIEGPVAAPTIDDLFDEIEDAIVRNAHELIATYDARFGFPADVSIDYLRTVIDEEMAFRVSGFAEISSGAFRGSVYAA